MRESMHRRPYKGGAECDAFSRFGRRYMKWLDNPGVSANIKAKYNRRARREARMTIKEDA